MTWDVSYSTASCIPSIDKTLLLKRMAAAEKQENVADVFPLPRLSRKWNEVSGLHTTLTDQGYSFQGLFQALLQISVRKVTSFRQSLLRQLLCPQQSMDSQPCFFVLVLVQVLGNTGYATRATFLKIYLDAQRQVALHEIFQIIFLLELCFWYLLANFHSSQSLINPKAYGTATGFNSFKLITYSVQGQCY